MIVPRIGRIAVTALLAAALAVAVRFAAALADIEVLAPLRGDDPVPLPLGAIVTTSVGVTVVAAVVTLLFERVRPGDGRLWARRLGLLVLVGSLVPVFLADGLAVADQAVLTVIHVVVAAVVLRGVVRNM